MVRVVDIAWTGTIWFVEGGISDCFGSLDHDIMIGIMAEKIHDNRFLRLMRNMLTAGCLEEWTWNATPAAPRRVVLFHQSCPVSTSLNWTRMLRQYSSRKTPRERCAGPIPGTTRSGRHCGGRVSAVAGPRPATCNDACTACPARTASPKSR